MPKVTIRIRVKDTGASRVALGQQSLLPTAADLQFAGERQRARIIDRTLMGLDWEGKPFIPYSDHSPVYFYPGVKGRAKESRRRTVKRYAKIAGRRATITRSGLGLRFENYAALKRAFGRSGNPDLFSVMNHPHMLNALIVQTKPPREIKIGIYGSTEIAARANAHNEGTDRLPRRHFLDISDADKELIAEDLATRIRQRLT